MYLYKHEHANTRAHIEISMTQAQNTKHKTNKKQQTRKNLR